MVPAFEPTRAAAKLEAFQHLRSDGSRGPMNPLLPRAYVTTACCHQTSVDYLSSH
jgi:hypothetical protein